MYDMVMANEDVGILPERLQYSIELRHTSPAQLARDSGVSKAAISQILSGDRPNTSATIVGRLARALDISVDYLIGITKDPEPKALDLGELLIELTRIAKQLPSRRQRDLLLMARTFLEAGEETRGNPDLLMSEQGILIFERPPYVADASYWKRRSVCVCKLFLFVLLTNANYYVILYLQTQTHTARRYNAPQERQHHEHQSIQHIRQSPLARQRASGPQSSHGGPRCPSQARPAALFHRQHRGTRARQRLPQDRQLRA